MSISASDTFGTLGAADDTLELSIGGFGTVGIQIAGTWVGTVTFEGTIDTGVWQTLNVVKTNGTSPVTSSTANGIWAGSVAGLRKVRARMSAYTSGAADVQLMVVGTGGGSGASGGGGSGGTSSDFGAAFPAAGTAAGFIGDDGNMAGGELDVDGNLKVNVVTGGGGSSPFGDPLPASGVAVGFEDASGDLAAVVLEADGSIPVTVIAGGGSNASVSATGAAVPADATFVGVDDGSGTLAGLAAAKLDYDTGAGTVAQSLLGIALPGAGGPVAGGTATNPFRVDPTGTTTQPVSAASLPLPSGASTLAEQQTQTTSLQLLDDVVATTAAAIPSKGFAVSGTDGTNARVLKTDTSGELQVDVLTLPSNASVNISQVNAATVNVGAGNAGTGTQRVSISTDDVNLAAINAVNGVTTGAKVITDANGTIQQYLRGLVSLAVTAGSFLVTAALSAGTNLIGRVGVQFTYSSKGTITWTGTSLANGSGRESTVIDNTSNRYKDFRIRIQTKGQASGTAYLDWYVYTSLGDTTYTDSATGSDAAFTAANRKNSRYLGSTLLNANTSAVIGELLLSDIFATCPDKWGLIGINNSGAALSATAGDHVLEYEGIY